MNDFKKVSILQERDLELKKQLSDINSASVKKLMKKEPELPVVQTKKIKLMTGTPQAIGDLALRDLAFQVQLDDIAEKAVGGKDIVPSKVNREITPEMIADFEDAQRVPVIGPDGNEYKYNPSALDINLQEYIPIHPIPDEVTVSSVKVWKEEDHKNLLSAYAKCETDIKAIKDMMVDVKSQYNTLRSEIQAKKDAATTKHLKKLEQDKINGLTKKYNADNVEFSKQIDRIHKKMKNIENDIVHLDAMEADVLKKLDENAAEKERISRLNEGQINAYIQDIQTLNADLNISRNIGETDEDFAARLMALKSLQISPGEEEEAIKRKNFLRMKSNLGKIISDTAKAEATTKLLLPEEQYEYNKREPIINKKFLEVYGINNKRVSENEIADFIKNLINENPVSLVSSSKAPPTPIKVPATPRAPSTPTPFAAAIPVIEPAGVRLRKHLETLGISVPDRLPIHEVLKEYDDNNFEIPDSIIPGFGKKIDKLYAEKINIRLRSTPIGLSAGPVSATASTAAAEPEPLVGVGVKKYPKLIKFGKIYISADDLYYKNILKVRSSKKVAIVGIPNVKVSDELATILLKIIDNEKVSKSHLNLLSKKERHIYDQICIMSGLHKTHDNTFDTTAEELKQQLETVEGEIFAGNNNPELLKEVHRLLWTMNSVGLLAGNTALKHFKDLKRIYF